MTKCFTYFSIQLNWSFQELDDIEGKLYDLLTIVYDFVMLHLCYIYFDILNDDVTVLHKKDIQISIVNFSCIHCNIIFNISSTCHSFYQTRHQMY